MKKVTIKDIASRAGVTPATVSMVLNRKPNISFETREKILRVARELNYVPNVAARGLVAGRTNSIGIIMPNLAEPFTVEVLRGIESVIKKSYYQLVLYDTVGRVELNEEIYRRIVQEGRVDGVIMVTVNMSDENLQRFVDGNIPAVILEQDTDKTDCVLARNQEGAYKAAKYLIDRGHCNIGVVHGSMRFQTYQERMRGFQKALAEHNLKFDRKWEVEIKEHHIEAGFEAAKYLMEIEPKPTAILCFAGDYVAVGIIQALKSLGHRIPEDVAVIGYDDLEYAQIIDPPLTTVRQPVFEMGSTAMKILIEKLTEGFKEFKRVIFDQRLIIRESA